jgi:hypothetical protein
VDSSIFQAQLNVDGIQPSGCLDGRFSAAGIPPKAYFRAQGNGSDWWDVLSKWPARFESEFEFNVTGKLQNSFLGFPVEPSWSSNISEHCPSIGAV